MRHAYQSWRTGTRIDNIYPVGAIYMSMEATDPGTLFGGTWEQITGKFLIAQNYQYAAGSTGGAQTVTMATVPSHRHEIGAHAHGLNSHTHTLNSHTHTMSHTHGTGNSTYTHFLSNDNTNIVVNTTIRQMPSTGGSAYFVYSTAGEGHQIAQRDATSGPSNNTSGGPSNNTSGGPSTSNTANSTAFDSGSAGSGTAINKMPPYLAVYMWKRIS